MLKLRTSAPGTLRKFKKPTLNSVRSLADKLAADADYDLKKIMHAMAHTTEDITKLYQECHQLPFDAVEIQFNEDDIGGNFA